MIVSKKSWHFRFYNWFNRGKLPSFIDLCSYVRTVIFWTPLKIIFYSPVAALYRMGKARFYLTAMALFVLIQTVLIFLFGGDALWFLLFLYILITCIPMARKVVVSDLKEAKAKKASAVQYAEKAGQALSTGLKYSLGIPLKAIFWTFWVKVFNFNRVLFGVILAIVVGVIFWWLVLIGVWWKVLAGIGALILLLAIMAGIVILADWLKGRRIDLDNNMAWQFLKAQKQKICPFVELRD